jgi:hypothetical protein
LKAANEKSQQLLAFDRGLANDGRAPKGLAFFGVSRAPAIAVNLFACKQGATASSISGLALVQSAVVAFLGSSVLREFFGIHLGGVGCIAQSRSLWVFFVDHGLSHGLLGCQSGTTQCHLHHENATISLFHKISNEVAKKSERTNITVKNESLLEAFGLSVLEVGHKG